MLWNAILLMALFTAFTNTIRAQTGNEGESEVRTITMDVVVMDMEDNARQGEKIVFVDSLSGEKISGVTNSEGQFTVELPGSSTYEVRIIGMGDYQDYQSVKIPELLPDRRYGTMRYVIQYEVPQVYTLDDVHFDVNKASLRKASYTELNELVDYLERKPGIRVEIAGHTDNTGEDDFNQKLSQRRADRVKQYLVSQGIDSGRVEAKGYGEDQPIAPNNTEKGRQQNRRTEVRILE